ncbi:MAG: sensor histidine kinase [Bosea sp. (in: a-proteobacteria)]
MILFSNDPPATFPSRGALALALGSFALALAARLAVDGWLPPGFPYLTFFPAVIVTAFFGGVGAGALCAVLCGLAAWYFFIPPVGFALNGQAALALGFYVFIVVVDIGLIYLMHRALNRLSAEKAVSAALAEQQRTMFEELQHRVSNNLAFIASLLNMSRRRIASDPATAPVVIDEARSRIEMMARIHRRLHDPNSVDVPVERYLEQMCSDVLGIAGVSHVTCQVTAPSITLDIRKLTTLSHFVTEVLTNSVKHAFPAGRAGRLAISLARQGDDYVLSVSDDGVGMVVDKDRLEGHGIGMRIMKSLASQLRGEWTVISGNGVTNRLVFPVH